MNIHTIKPIDEELILNFAKQSQKFVTVEGHNIIGGLGSAVSEVIAQSGLPVKILRIWMTGFGESGSPEGLYGKFGLSVDKIRQKVIELLTS